MTLIFAVTSLKAHMSHKTENLNFSDKETDMGEFPKLIEESVPSCSSSCQSFQPPCQDLLKTCFQQNLGGSCTDYSWKQ